MYCEKPRIRGSGCGHAQRAGYGDEAFLDVLECFDFFGRFRKFAASKREFLSQALDFRYLRPTRGGLANTLISSKCLLREKLGREYPTEL